jgi:hypothetical protein
MVMDVMDERILSRLRGKPIAAFCIANHVRRLSLYGSIISDRFTPESDIDLLVEFDPEHLPTLLDIARMEAELSVILFGRKVDLRTYEDLSRYFRDVVVSGSVVVYAGA